ncbi:ASKHA domain-containing protein [Bacillus benzoevorans]|nr:ASKHA domain-containing protein [Bacillus benzoevorans]
MVKIAIRNRNTIIDHHGAISGDLLEVLSGNEIFVDNACNGKGSCGKCKIRVVEGQLPEISETEKSLLKKEEIESGVRLACLVTPKEDIVIEVLQKERKHEILTKGYMPDFSFRQGIRKTVIDIEKPTLENQASYEDSLCSGLGLARIDWNLLAGSKAGSVPIFGEVTGVFAGDELIGIEAGDTRNGLYGVAIDIGTTTVVCALVDLNTGAELATASMINPQKKFGLDVLTRITYQIENGKLGREKLQHEIVKGINTLIGELCAETKISRDHVYELTVAANCTMLHFLLGIDAASIGKSPYAPVFVRAKTVKAKDLGLKAAPGASVYCLPSVSSYIGADIVSGVYVCELHKQSGNILFIDIGTNGEIVLANNGNLLSCSCAAGPALEGMNISSGMRAAEGAIEDLKITEENGIELKVIGNEEPIGLCGSGILAVVKELIRTGLVKKDGAFIKKEKLAESDYRYDMLQLDGKKREFVIKTGGGTSDEKNLFITQGDVRQVQLAKGAILSGFYALLKQADIDMNQLDKVMIAGQFGAHLPADSLVGVGILPEAVRDKLEYVGNSSKTGAYMALMSVDVRKQMEDLAKEMDYLELGASEGYERLFTKCLMFV